MKKIYISQLSKGIRDMIRTKTQFIANGINAWYVPGNTPEYTVTMNRQVLTQSQIDKIISK